MSWLFAAMLAASFTVVPGHTPETSHSGTASATQQRIGSGLGGTDKTSVEKVDPGQDAKNFLDDFFSKAGASDKGPSVLFATIADPVQTHLAAVFDHDVAALQDGVQDSGFLFDSSWIPWDTPRAYDSVEDEVDAANLRGLRHRYPGILLFRRGGSGAPKDDPAKKVPAKYDDPYANGLIVFLLAEKPTAGVSLSQARNALHLLSTMNRKPGGATRFALKEPVMILGPEFSGSLHSLIPLVKLFTSGEDVQPAHAFLIRSGSFTSRSAAESAANQIDGLHLSVDMGSAFHPFEAWTGIALTKLNQMGIRNGNVAVLSEGESLFGEATTGEAKPEKNSPFNLEFPRDISALRSSYEKQGLLDNPTAADIQKRALHLDAEEARSGDSIRSYGQQETVAAQESVLFGISEFVRAHNIHAVIIVATSEEDNYFLTRFLHTNNAGVRVLVVGSTRLFMRGPTAEFRGDMMISPFPLLPRLYDWTPLSSGDRAISQDQTEHTFPNDSSAGVYYAVRDLLWVTGDPRLPRGYSRPRLKDGGGPLQPGIYVSAMGGGTAWPVSEDDTAFALAGEGQCTVASNTKAAGLRMPFPFGCHLLPEAVKVEAAKNDPLWKGIAFRVTAGSFWQLGLWFCVAVPAFYCFGIRYSDPVRRAAFAFLQPPAEWQQWILLMTVPALLSEGSLLMLARQMVYPWSVAQWSLGWLATALMLSAAMPLMIVRLNRRGGERAGCFKPGDTETGKSNMVFRATTIAVVVIFLAAVAIFVAVVAAEKSEVRGLAHVLDTYREMHWESGLSLLPTVMFLIFAIAVWNYEALVGTSILHTRPKLPDFPNGERFSDRAASRIIEAGYPFPRRQGSHFYWRSLAVMGLVMVAAFCLWPSFRALTSLSAWWVTGLVLVLALVAALLMLMDILQFVWLWKELRVLLQMLNHQPFKRSFNPLRQFNWSSVWSFSNGSLQEKRAVMAAQFKCALDLEGPIIRESETKFLKCLGKRYAKLEIAVSLFKYRKDISAMHACFARIGSRIAEHYREMLAQAPAAECEPGGPASDEPFGDERREVAQLPGWLCLYERFLCLQYLAFIRVIIARLRTLAISIVSAFSFIGLAFAIYPFEPSLPLFVTGACALLAIAVVMFVVFSQMDKDPVLARILQSNPNKLEWSFYGKYIDALALPVLTLLSTLLPGGAGRLIDLLRTVFSHAQ